MNLTIPCPCPGTSHPDGDTLTFRDKLDFERAMTVVSKFQTIKGEGLEGPPLIAAMMKMFVVVGLEAWTLLDANGRPLVASPDTIAATLDSLDVLTGVRVSNAVDGLYTGPYILPLLVGAPPSSPPMSTDEPTSAPTDSDESPVSPTPSSQSSTFITPTDAIVRTSLSLVGAPN